MQKPKSQNFSIVIVADGDFPTHPIPLEKLRRADCVIACDGATESLVANGFEPNFIVGDIDSLSPDYQDTYKNIIVQVSEQESNDLSKAFRFALGLIKPSSLTTLDILALSGKREDHTIGNISLLADYQKMATEFSEPPVIKGYTDYGFFEPHYSLANHPIKIEGRKGCAVSIFAFDNSLTITSEGLEYQTSGVVFDMWWKATLNKVVEDAALLHLNHTASVLLYYPY